MAPGGAGASSAERPTIAWLSGGAPELNAPFIESFLRGMKELGYVEGRDFDMVYRYTEGYQERLTCPHRRGVGLKPNVILAPAVIGAVAAKKVNVHNPIVSTSARGCRSSGLNIKRGETRGNVTGIEPYVAGLPAKQIEFAREIVPAANKIGSPDQFERSKGPGSSPGIGSCGTNGGNQNYLSGCQPSR